mgnify:CR=1 FL=1
MSLIVGKSPRWICHRYGARIENPDFGVGGSRILDQTLSDRIDALVRLPIRRGLGISQQVR